jgi:hypothetical protein
LLEIPVNPAESAVLNGKARLDSRPAPPQNESTATFRLILVYLYPVEIGYGRPARALPATNTENMLP